VLNVEMRFMIHELFRQGVSISEIARLTDHDRKTVRKVLAEPLSPPRRPRKSKARKIEPYAPYLQKRLEEGVFNASKLFYEIHQQGYPGQERQVRAYVHPLRAAYLAQRDATLRFETEPGEQAQVDWGHFGMIRYQERLRPLYGFVMTLGWSRAMYLEFTVSADIAWFLRCHRHAFEYFGGVPRQILHDNLKTAVLAHDADGTVHWNPRYLDFAHYYGFSPRACKPYRAQTKGKVENGIKYVRGNFWLGLHFLDLLDLNQQGVMWLDTVANVRLHGTTHEIPVQRLAHEGLPALRLPPYDTSLLTYRQSSRDCLVSYGGNYYSVPAAYARQPLQLKITEQDEVIVFSPDSEEIARHRLATGRHQRVVVAAHYQGLPTKTPRKMRAGGVQDPPAEVGLTAGGAPVPEIVVEARPLSVYAQWADAEVAV
jgi:transposase